MQIKRLLNDRLVVAGDKLITSQGEHCEFVEHANGRLVTYHEILSRSYGHNHWNLSNQSTVSLTSCPLGGASCPPSKNTCLFESGGVPSFS